MALFQRRVHRSGSWSDTAETHGPHNREDRPIHPLCCPYTNNYHVQRGLREVVQVGQVALGHKSLIDPRHLFMYVYVCMETCHVCVFVLVSHLEWGRVCMCVHVCVYECEWMITCKYMGTCMQPRVLGAGWLLHACMAHMAHTTTASPSPDPIPPTTHTHTHLMPQHLRPIRARPQGHHMGTPVLHRRPKGDRLEDQGVGQDLLLLLARLATGDVQADGRARDAGHAHGRLEAGQQAF